MSKAHDFFTEEQREQLLASIKDAEKVTSGEIRLFIENKCKEDALDRVAFIFTQLKMHETKHRNGVLIYVALESRKFAIIGDVGIHTKVHKDFWHDVKTEMQKLFMKGDFVNGICHGIKIAGETMKKHFPHKDDDINELPDDVVYGE